MDTSRDEQRTSIAGRVEPEGGRSQRGSVLVFVLAALALAGLFGASLSALVRLEGRAGANLLEAARARFAAEAGLERALYLLTEHELAEPICSFHAPWTYRAQGGATWGLDEPLDEAQNPSFLEGATASGVAYSGRVARGAGDELFTLAVVDLSSRLYLNGKADEGISADTLNALGRAIADFDRRRSDPADSLFDPGYAARVREGRAGARDPIAGRGAAIVALRARGAGAFRALEELEAVLGADDVRALKPYLTVEAWRHPDQDRRAPVNLNTAPWPVLVGCMEGLELDGSVVGPESARALADAIDARRRDPALGPFTGIQDLARFFAQPEVAALAPRSAREAILLNGSPVPMDQRRNPDAAVVLAPYGPDDLHDRTTFFSFISQGLFEVASLGRVLDREGVTRAAHRLRAVVDVYDTLRLSSQEDLELARGEEDPWQIDTYPNPVTELAGPLRLRFSGAEPPVKPPVDPPDRTDLRYRIADSGTGYLQAAPAPPYVPLHGGPQRAHVFHFNADLRGRILDGTTVLGTQHVPEVGGLWEELFAVGYAVGTDPTDHGVPEVPANPTPVIPDRVDTTVYEYVFLPDGLLVDYEAPLQVRYPNVISGGERLLTSSGVVLVRFKIGADGPEWVPLLEARVRPDERYAGLGAHDYVDLQVHVRHVEAGGIRLRSRIRSTAPASVASPGLNAGMGPTPALEVEHEVHYPSAGPHEWHLASVPFHLNLHAPLLNGARGERVPADQRWPWALPAWGPEVMDRVAPGGFERAAPGANATIDDLVVVGFGDDATGLKVLNEALQAPVEGDPQSAEQTQRFERAGPDLLGTFVGEMPPVGEAPLKLGAAVWEEFVPTAWNGVNYEQGDFLVQLTYGLGAEIRRQVSPRLIAPPSPRPVDLHALRWRLRWLRQRQRELERRHVHAVRLAGLAGRRDDARSAQTFRAQAAAAGAALDDVVREADALVRRGAASDPPPNTPGRAFGAPLLRLEPDRVGFQVDLIFLPRGHAAQNASSVVGELQIPYQISPRVLAREHGP